MSDFSILQELFSLVRKIPKGKVVSYGALGHALSRPVSGLLIGKWIANAPPEVPWWRVVAKSGDLPVSKRDPSLGILQRHHLEMEGVAFIGDQVDMDSHSFDAILEADSSGSESSN